MFIVKGVIVNKVEPIIKPAYVNTMGGCRMDRCLFYCQSLLSYQSLLSTLSSIRYKNVSLSDLIAMYLIYLSQTI